MPAGSELTFNTRSQPWSDPIAQHFGRRGVHGGSGRHDECSAWLVHCYGMLGAGRDNSPDSGGGIELYVVIGHAPRHLDRNVTLFGRVLSGMERLTSLPRGTAPLGFYEKPEQRVPIQRVRIAADVPAAERTELEILRTDTPTFEALVEARRNRREEWFQRPAGQIEICNVLLVVRAK
ncbi:MAG: peptidylprolyl isomerase [Deltaproteobacteria bacterium]